MRKPESPRQHGPGVRSLAFRRLFRHSSFVIRHSLGIAVAILLSGCITDGSTPSSQNSSTASVSYPVTRKTNVVDDYNGVKVADPYRWLEDDNSPETKAWVEAQNKITIAYLQNIPELPAIRARVQRYLDHGIDTAFLQFQTNDPDPARRRALVLDAMRALAPAARS